MGCGHSESKTFEFGNDFGEEEMVENDKYDEFKDEINCLKLFVLNVLYQMTLVLGGSLDGIDKKQLLEGNFQNVSFQYKQIFENILNQTRQSNS